MKYVNDGIKKGNNTTKFRISMKEFNEVLSLDMITMFFGDDVTRDFIFFNTSQLKPLLKATPTTKPASVVKPAKLTGLSVTISKNKATLSWKAVSGATAYNVYYKKQNGSYKVLATKSTNLQISNLNKSTKYLFKVAAANSAGEGKASDEITKSIGK